MDLTNNKRTVVFTLAVCSLSMFQINTIHAFQAGFQTHDNTPPPPPPSPFDNRLIINSPYSLCKLDGIETSLCLQLGLRLWMPTFQKYNIHADFNIRFGYDANTQEVDASQIQDIIDAYHIPPYVRGTFDLPTEGQLVWMFNNKYVSVGGQGTRHFVRQGTDSKAIRVATIGEGFGDYSRAKLSRLVTSAIPDECQDNECDVFENKRGFTMVMDSACGWSWNWRVEGIDAEGTKFNFSKSGEGKLEIPFGAQRVDIGMRSLKINSYAWRREINLTDRKVWTDYECYRLGSCTGYTILNGFTEEQCQAKFDKVKKTYDIKGECIKGCG